MTAKSDKRVPQTEVEPQNPGSSATDGSGDGTT